MSAIRIFRKHWKLAAIAIFSLSTAMALGVLALSIANTFLFVPPAAAAPDRLVMVHSRSISEAIGLISYPDYKYFQENNHVFSDLAAAPNSIQIEAHRTPGDPEVKLLERSVSGNYFAVMGVRPYLGRVLSPDDDQAKAAVAVITYSAWVRLGADPNIIGKVLGKQTIVGITPREFTGSFYGLNGDLLTPLGQMDSNSNWLTKRDARQLLLIGRLKPGISRSQAQSEMTALSGQLAAAYPKEDKDRTALVTRATLLPPDALSSAESIIGILLAAVLLVLLIACTNVANLLLAVAVERRQEASIKLALGAQRTRLMWEFLKESASICAISAALGYSIAAVLIARYSDFTVEFSMIGTLPLSLNLRLDATVAAFTAGLTLVAILATGMAPALYASAPNLAQVLSGEIAVGGTGKDFRRRTLVIVQVAVCTLVLIGMGLSQRSLYNLRHADPGFSTRNLVAIQVMQKNENVPAAQGRALWDDLIRQVSVLPGVESASLASALPLLSVNNENVQLPDGSKKVPVDYAAVDSRYFDTFGVRVLAGRAFNSTDRENSPTVAMINRTMADMFWPGQDALGKSVAAGEPAPTVTVVGIVADGKYEDLDEGPRPFIYYALSQRYKDAIYVVAKTKGDPQFWIAPLTKTVRVMDLAFLRPVTFDDWVNLALLPERVIAGCGALLSALGLLLASVGLFGAVSYSVSERRRELGIRTALGAQPRQLLIMILRQTAVIAGIGIAIGVLLGVGATALLHSRFYGISAMEWTVLLPVSVVMLAMALLIAYFSARPWIAIDPMEAVRHA